MDETTVFNNPAPVQPNQQTVQPEASEPSLNQDDFNKKRFSPKTLIKLIIGLIFISILAFIIFGFLLPNFTKDKDEAVTLSYWGLFEDENIMKPVISDFESKNPGIKVIYEKQDPRQYREKLETRIANGTGPDIFRFHNTWVPQITDSILPLPSDTMTVSEFKKVFYPVAQKDLIKNGAIYGIPYEIDTLSLFVNSDMLATGSASIPETWTDFINTARTLTIKDQNGKIVVAGAALGTFDNITYAPDIISLLLIQNGVDPLNISQNKQRAVDAFNFYTSFALLEGNVWDNTLDQSLVAFSQGRLSLYFGYLKDYFTIKQLNPNLKFTIAPVPQLPEQSITLASYWVEGASLKSKYQKEALLFLKFLSEKATAEKLYDSQASARGFGQVPGRSDLANKAPVNSPVSKQAPSATSTFFADGTFDDGLNSQMNGHLKEALNSIIGGTGVETAIETLSQKISQTLASFLN